MPSKAKNSKEDLDLPAIPEQNCIEAAATVIKKSAIWF